MPESSEVFKFHFAQYLKWFDVFETRQTWTFNFAIGVYGIAIATGGSLLEKVISTPAFRNPVGSQEVDVGITAMSLIFSIALPLVLLPLCYLFVDVSIYCAALSVVQRAAFYKHFGVEVVDPTVSAYEWLKANGLALHPRANRRVILFLWAPSFGVLVALSGLYYSVFSRHVWPVAALAPGLLISVVSLVETIRAYITNGRARRASMPA